MCISHTSRFSLFLSIFKVIECLCLIFHVFQFSCHNQSLHCVFLIFKVFFLLFLTIFHVIQCISHFTGFSVFLAIFHVVLCEFFHFPRLSVFSPHSRSYIVKFSFFTFFSVSRTFPVHTVFVFHFPHFSIFSPYSMSYSVCFSFHTFFTVYRHISFPTL